MKTNLFLIMAIATFVLLSCSNEEPPAGTKAGRSKLSILIKGEKEAPKGRTAGNPTQVDESKINDFIVFVFKANGDNDINPREYTAQQAPDNTVAELEITTDARKVYIIANTQTATAVNSQLKAVTNIAGLRSIIGRGFATPGATSVAYQTSTNLWMSGENETDLNPTEGGNITATVKLKYVGAKVRITKVAVENSVVPNLSSDLILTDVMVFNGASATHFLPAAGKTSLIPVYEATVNEPFYTGAITMPAAFTNKPTFAGRNNEYGYALISPFQIEEGKNQAYFYVFENDGLSFDYLPTIVTLKARDSEFNEFFYSVLFKMDSALPTPPEGYDNKIIERGNSYDIALTIKKWGAKDPTIPALKTTVDVTITPATWKTEIINKTFE